MPDADRDLNMLVAKLVETSVRVQHLTTVDVRELAEVLRRVLAHPSEHFRQEQR